MEEGYAELADGFAANVASKPDWSPVEREMLATIDIEKLLAVERRTAAVIRFVLPVSLAGLLLLTMPRGALAEALTIVEDRIYRAGVFLVVDALVGNESGQRVDGVEATVELRDFFDAVLRLEHAGVSPATLGPGQVGALRIATPFSDAVRKVHYRLTWRQRWEQFQAIVQRDVWTIGAATRESSADRRGPRVR